MPDQYSSGMPVVDCTGMLKDQFSGRLIGLRCELSKSHPNLNKSLSQFDLTPPSPPQPQGALLQICLQLSLTSILDNYFWLSLETILDNHSRLSEKTILDHLI